MPGRDNKPYEMAKRRTDSYVKSLPNASTNGMKSRRMDASVVEPAELVVVRVARTADGAYSVSEAGQWQADFRHYHDALDWARKRAMMVGRDPAIQLAGPR